MEPNKVLLGNNLEILSGMEDGSVDLVYADPPYNSNRDYGQFDDRFGGMEGYLTMMSPVLFECQRLLKPDGSIYVQADSSAVHYLKVEMDQIFGVQMFKNDIVWKRSAGKGMVSKKYGCQTDHILFYSNRDLNADDILIPLSEEYIKKQYRYEDSQNTTLTAPGKSKHLDLTAPGKNKGAFGTAGGLHAGILSEPARGVESEGEWRGLKPQGRRWNAPRNGKYADFIEEHIPGYKAVDSVFERLDLLDEHGFISWSNTGKPTLKRYLMDDQGMPPSDLWTDIPFVGGSAKEQSGYPTQKPVKLLQRIIKASSNEGDLVLDPFCGSGTTLVAAKLLHRNYLGIDMNPNAVELSNKRLEEAKPETLPEAISAQLFLED